MRAKFSFFDSAEWDRLVSDGGRIGELAARAGAEEELEKLRLQVVQMREKAQARLGRKFELLLGTEHDYGAVDDALMRRYVCLGDDTMAAGAASRAGSPTSPRRPTFTSNGGFPDAGCACATRPV